MKRNIGVLVLLLAQLLKSQGVNIEIGQTELDTLASAAGILTATVGVLHDAYRRWQAARAAKKVQ